MTTTTTPTTASDLPVKFREVYPGRCGGFKAWVQDLAQSLLMTTPPPADGIMSHHGLYFPWRGLTFTIAPHGETTMRLTLERNLSRCDWKRAHGRRAEAGLKRRTWRRLQAAMALAFGKQIADRWNGEDGHTSASLTIETPEALRWMHGAVDNYGALRSVFDYDDATAALFQKVSGWHKGLLESHAVKTREPRLAYHKIDSATVWLNDDTRAWHEREKLEMKGRLFRPLDHAVEQRPEAFKAALAKIHDIGRTYFPEGELAITTQPTPRP